MATTAHAVTNPNITAPDDVMDLHSDDGIDFDDGDIELDIDLPPPSQPQDDDVSIKDAVTDAELDPTHSTIADPDYFTADPDDFMADHEDYGAGNVQYGNEAYQDPLPLNHTTAAQEQAPAPPDDDDLIDYSDEEEDDQPPPAHTPAKAYTPVSNSGNDASIHKDNIQDGEDAVYETNDQEHHLEDDPVYETNDQEHHHDEDPVYETNDQEHRHEDESGADNEVDNHTEDEEGGVLLEDLEAQNDSSEHQLDSSEEQRSVESRPITVNYEGNELWLFKQHDTEDSGDWLVDDISLIHSSLSDLFRAFRASLGEDLSNETELGLRFDHFHNMELFEDSTACVAVSLERMIDLYHTLHAQDGESDPESFYMCLLSRPRFATLLSDVAKHAEQGSGYSGLNSAVAAGETHFADLYSGHSTEHEGAEWDHEDGVDAEEEELEQQKEGTESASEAESEVAHVEHEEQYAAESEGDDNIDNKEITGTEHDDVSTTEGATQLDQDSHDDNDPTPQNAAEGGEESTQPEVLDQATQPTAQALSSEQEEQLAHDTVDYSDQEDEDEPRGGNPDAASLSSATVQGDNPVTGEVSLQVAESANPVEEEEDYHYDDQDVTDNTLIGGHSGDAQTEEQSNHDDNTESYQDYAQVYDQGDPFKEFQMDAPDAYTTEPDYSGLTNQDDAPTYEYQDLEQQFQDDFTNGADFDGTGAGESTNVENDIANGDDILDLDNAPEWSLAEDTVVLPDDDEVYGQAEEEEDGVLEQPEVAASSAADPVAASSKNLHEDSPQGTKRSIDEVGDSVGDALDYTGTLWAPKSLLNVFHADTVVSDMKRPRV
jgi:hypothetical protein